MRSSDHVKSPAIYEITSDGVVIEDITLKDKI
jgi:hypothetical protein